MAKDSSYGSVDYGQHRALVRPWPLGRTRWAMAGVVAGVIGSSWVGVGRHWPKGSETLAGTADATEGTIDGAVRKVTQGIQDVSTSVRGRFDDARAVTRGSSLVAEVKARLQQDKALDAAQIDVFVEQEGVVILKGEVPDKASKNLAVDLTRDIRGVVSVDDHLAIPPRGRLISAASDDDPTTAISPRRTR
jgi:hypothetical protein